MGGGGVGGNGVGAVGRGSLGFHCRIMYFSSEVKEPCAAGAGSLAVTD